MDHHPYFPPDLVISNYVPNQLPRSRLLMIVGSLATLIVSISFLSAKGRKLSTSESLRFSWFVVCVPLHCGFEAYWLWYSETIASRSDLLSELWKEYAHGDSRYLSVDPVLYALETITAVRVLVDCSNVEEEEKLMHMPFFQVRLGPTLSSICVRHMAKISQSVPVATNGIAWPPIFLWSVFRPRLANRVSKLQSTSCLLLGVFRCLQFSMVCGKRH